MTQIEEFLLAAKNGYTQKLEQLIPVVGIGAKLEERSEHPELAKYPAGTTALMVAIDNISSSANVLLDHHSNSGPYMLCKNADGQSIFTILLNTEPRDDRDIEELREISELLLEKAHKAKIDLLKILNIEQNSLEQGTTFIVQAIERNLIQVVLKLIDLGVPYTGFVKPTLAHNINVYNPLEAACYHDRTRIFSFLINGKYYFPNENLGGAKVSVRFSNVHKDPKNGRLYLSFDKLSCHFLLLEMASRGHAGVELISILFKEIDKIQKKDVGAQEETELAQEENEAAREKMNCLELVLQRRNHSYKDNSRAGNAADHVTAYEVFNLFIEDNSFIELLTNDKIIELFGKAVALGSSSLVEVLIPQIDSENIQAAVDIAIDNGAINCLSLLMENGAKLHDEHVARDDIKFVIENTRGLKIECRGSVIAYALLNGENLLFKHLLDNFKDKMQIHLQNQVFLASQLPLGCYLLNNPNHFESQVALLRDQSLELLTTDQFNIQSYDVAINIRNRQVKFLGSLFVYAIINKELNILEEIFAKKICTRDFMQQTLNQEVEGISIGDYLKHNNQEYRDIINELEKNGLDVGKKTMVFGCLPGTSSPTRRMSSRFSGMFRRTSTKEERVDAGSEHGPSRSTTSSKPSGV